MITGFNTDVPHQDCVYHVQTEDRGTKDNPVLESLVYIGGTIIAKKRTPYADKLSQGADEATIATLLKKQHQVMIAAIKAGRIEELIQHSEKHSGEKPPEARLAPAPETRPASIPAQEILPVPEIRPEIKPELPKRKSGFLPPALPKGKSGFLSEPKRSSGLLARSQGADKASVQTTAQANPSALPSRPTKTNSGVLKTGSLNLDEVISDYLKRSSEQEKLDVKVIAPSVFIAGKTITLRIEVKQGTKVESDAIVTVKIIGTAFKPQVFIGRAAGDGVATFNLVLPAFSSGTAAIVIEVQSRYGRGELKHLIRRA